METLRFCADIRVRTVRAANDRVPTRTWNVGRPNAISMMSLARFKLWWMMPKHTTKANEVPPETQMMLTKLPIGKDGVGDVCRLCGLVGGGGDGGGGGFEQLC